MKNFQLTDPLYQTLIGFENLISRATTTNTYPPYNLFKDVLDNYVLEIAVAGWDRDELDVQLMGTTLTVTGTKEPTETREYLHRGLAHRSWTRTWTLEPDIKVVDVTLTNGVLWIKLVQKSPTTTKKIEIN